MQVLEGIIVYISYIPISRMMKIMNGVSDTHDWFDVYTDVMYILDFLHIKSTIYSLPTIGNIDLCVKFWVLQNIWAAGGKLSWTMSLYQPRYIIW